MHVVLLQSHGHLLSAAELSMKRVRSHSEFLRIVPMEIEIWSRPHMMVVSRRKAGESVDVVWPGSSDNLFDYLVCDKSPGGIVYILFAFDFKCTGQNGLVIYHSIRLENKVIVGGGADDECNLGGWFQSKWIY